MLLTFGIFEIPIRRIGGQRLAGHPFAAKDITYLLACVLCVPFVEEVLHRHEIADPFGGVDVVHNGDIPNAQTVKLFFHELTDDQAIPAKAGVIFHNECSDQTLLRQLHDFGEGRTCKRHT